jgi:hypothetical protein
MFAERVQYYRERLQEARDQLAHIDIGTHSWMDTKAKIENQESRVRTLETVYAEQKKVFAGKDLIRV